MAKVPLESIALERAVLGACLRDPSVFEDQQQRLDPEVFVDRMHRRIVAAFHALVGMDRAITASAVVARIAVEDEGVSPEGYLATLMAEDVDPTIIGELVDDLVEMYARRTLAEHGQACIQSASEDIDATAQERVDKAIDRTKAIGAMVAKLPEGDKAIDRVIQHASNAYRDQSSGGYDWFLPEITHAAGGDKLEPGWMTGLVCDSGAGKTSLALQEARFLASQGTPVLFLSGDQTEEDCYRQMASQEIGIESGEIRNGHLSEEDFGRLIAALEPLKQLPIEIVKMTWPKMSWVGNVVRNFVRRRGKGVVMADHAKRFKFDDPRGGLSEGVNQIMGDWKSLMLATGCAGLMLMQRNSEDNKPGRTPRPLITDVYGGRGASESFDTVLALWVEERWIKQRLPGLSSDSKEFERLNNKLAVCEGKADMIGLKCRFGPDGRTKRIIREARFTRFSSLKAVYDQERMEM